MPTHMPTHMSTHMPTHMHMHRPTDMPTHMLTHMSTDMPTRRGALHCHARACPATIIGISASPTACRLRGYGHAGTQSDRLGEAVILSTGTTIPAQRTCRRRCRDRASHVVMTSMAIVTDMAPGVMNWWPRMHCGAIIGGGILVTTTYEL